MKGGALHKTSAVAHLVDSCGKVHWPSQEAAVNALNDFKKNGSSKKKKPVRVYECETCKGWHLTSQGGKFHKNRQQEARRKFKKLGRHTKKATDRVMPADDAFSLLKKMRQQTIDDLSNQG